MSNKPKPESVAKVLAAGIVPGCRVRDINGVEGIVRSVDVWWLGRKTARVYSGELALYDSYNETVLATILEPAPSLPDTFNASAHSHLITERFPATDEQP